MIQVQLRYGPHQVPRGALPDAVSGDRLYLIKRVPVMHATYQVRLLALRAQRTGVKLVLRLPKSCKIAAGLAELRRDVPGLILIERV